MLFVSCTLVGQINFYKTYTGSAFDEGQGIVQIPDSSYAITGSSGAFSESSGQAYLMLVDSLGGHLWTKSYGGSGSDWGRRVFHKPGVGYVIAGYTNTTIDGSFNFYLIQTDELGNLISEKNFGTSNWERLWDAVMLSDEGLLLVGESEGENSQMKDMYIVRTDNQGDTLWTKTIATPNDDVAYAVVMIDDTTFAVGGDSWENGQPRSTILNMHIDGTTNWQNYYGDTVETGIRDLAYYDNYLFAGGYILPIGQTDWDYWALKTDMSGLFLKDLTDPGEEKDFISGIVVKNLAEVYLALASDSPDLGAFPEGTDAFVFKFDGEFFYKGFSNSYSGVNPDKVNQIIYTLDTSIAFVGTCGDDRYNPSMGSDVMVVKIGPNDETSNTADSGNDLVSVSVISKDQEFKVYPNPTAETLFIPAKLKGCKYSIYNSFGKEIQRGDFDSVLDVSFFKSGVYHIKVLHDDSYSTVRFIKK
jgi:hypothetical protein